MNLAQCKTRGVLLLSLLALAACQQQKALDSNAESSTGPDAKPGIAVTDGVLTLPVVKGRPGAAYFTLTNGGKASAILAAIVIDGSAKAEMHETKGGGMAPLPTVEVKPGATVKFERGGKHVMVFDIADTVKAGSTAEMTLTFAGGDKVSTPLKVETLAGDSMADMPGMDKH